MPARKRGREKSLPSKIVVYGKESMEKVVARSGSCGRIYFPSSWAGKRVLIIRLNEEVYDDRQRNQA